MNATETKPSPTAPLYEELPYPGDGVVRTTVAGILRRGLETHAPGLLTKPGLRVCDVGCGTGEATCGLAKRFPGARVVGVDVNPPSLELADALARRERLNVTFIRADASKNLPEQLIEQGVMKPEEPFDVLTSMGVLHHLENPADGFEQVRRLTGSGSLFLGYIYSLYGRRDDVWIKRLLDEAGVDRTAFQNRARVIGALRLSRKHTLVEALRTLRRRLRFGPPLHLLELLRVARRRRRLTHVSDTFSNPREHLFTFAELESLWDRAGWEFVDLAERGGLPTRAERHASDAEALQLLKQVPRAWMYDYFAFHYRAAGFTFFLKPRA